MINYCPLPRRWNAIYLALKNAWQTKTADEPELQHPPFPLILDHWAGSSDDEKFQRWEATLSWAEKWGLSELIPSLEEDECYPHAATGSFYSPFDSRRQIA